ncbi:hypothetical protein PP613_26070 [Mycobacteroides abscessus]|nr:hypothetical protein [Mycobacteroides abscessus]MDM2412817.1 hypothetical protein [Mycobacteroides abscessus]
MATPKTQASCSRCGSAEDRRYTEAVEALLDNGATDRAVVRAFFEYVAGKLTAEEMEYLVGGNGRLASALRPAVAKRYGLGD